MIDKFTQVARPLWGQLGFFRSVPPKTIVIELRAFGPLRISSLARIPRSGENAPLSVTYGVRARRDLQPNMFSNIC